MKTKTIVLYEFDELDENAKDRARTWYRSNALDYEWWDYLFEDFNTIAKGLGFNLHTQRSPIAIFFSGFYTKGSGACIAGTYHAECFNFQDLQTHFGRLENQTDEEIVRIITAFQTFAVEHPTFNATLTHTGNYSHEYSVSYECNEDVTVDRETEETFKTLARDFMRWVYKSLERGYEYLSSNERIDECIRASEYTFTLGGKPED